MVCGRGTGVCKGRGRFECKTEQRRELHMASGFSILLEPILRRTSYQDRKYDVQADARRGSIDVTGRLAPERTRWYSSVKTALSTAHDCTVQRRWKVLRHGGERIPTLRRSGLNLLFVPQATLYQVRSN